MKPIRITYKAVNDIDLSHLIPFIKRKDHQQIINAPAGQRHYKLLNYLAGFSETNIIELGTHHGTSSLAMSDNTEHKIITFDVKELYGIDPPPANVKQYIGNIFKLQLGQLMLDSDVVFIDTAHEGDFEWEVYEYLDKRGFKGVLVMDDIHLNKAMQEVWDRIDRPKYDVTPFGHGISLGGERKPGTGLVDFGNHIQDISYMEE